MDQCLHVIFFTIFIQFIKDPPKTNLVKTRPQGNKKRTYSQRFYTSVSAISDQTQWSMCFHNNLKSGFREMSTSSSSYLMICVSSVARNNQLSDCFMYLHQAIIYTTAISRIYVLKKHSEGCLYVLCTMNKVFRNQKVE